MRDYREAFAEQARAEGFAEAIRCLDIEAACCRALLPREGPDLEGARWQLETLAGRLGQARAVLETWYRRFYGDRPEPAVTLEAVGTVTRELRTALGLAP